MPATVFVATGYLEGGVMWNDRIIEAVRNFGSTSATLDCAGLGVVSLGTMEERRSVIETLLTRLKYLPSSEREARSREIQSELGGSEPDGLMLTTRQVAHFSQYRIDVGAHTVTHPILRSLDAVRARYEIGESRRRLEAITGTPIELFAYPNGRPGEDYSPEHVRMVSDAGYSAAVTTAWGSATPRTDRFQLPRFTPWSRDPLRFDLLMLRNMRSTPAAAVS
jgi:peptidoglycan/xylan/chitin deacetylase (PgdA/CDA1 family)